MKSIPQEGKHDDCTTQTVGPQASSEELLMDTDHLRTTGTSTCANYSTNATTPSLGLSPLSKSTDASLSTPLRILFGLNGLSLALPGMALMYINNTRAKIPVAYLSAYGALAFLPWSLKPLYAALSNLNCCFAARRDRLITILLISSGLSVCLTALVPENGILLCFILGIVRGVTSAWPEFLLGVTLIDQAKFHARVLDNTTTHNADTTSDTDDTDTSIDTSDDDSSYNATQSSNRGTSRNSSSSSFDHVAALFQSQAATCRNFGSLVSHIITFLLFALRHYVLKSQDELSEFVVTGLLMLTGFLTFGGAIIAYRCKVGVTAPIISKTTRVTTRKKADTSGASSSARQRYDLIDSNTGDHDEENDDVNDPKQTRTSLCDGDSYSSLEECLHHPNNNTSSPISPPRLSTTYFSFVNNDVVLVALFQIAIVVFSLRGPIIKLATYAPILWNVSFGLIMTALVTSVVSVPRWTTHHRVGVYLVLRHAFPSLGYLGSSYSYWVFESSPLFLQVISLVTTSVTTAASWSYGKVFAKFSSGWHLRVVICATTIFASLASLSQIWLIRSASAIVTDGAVMKESVGRLVPLAIFISIVTSFCDDWRFLPSVILATTSAKSTDVESSNGAALNDTNALDATTLLSSSITIIGDAEAPYMLQNTEELPHETIQPHEEGEGGVFRCAENDNLQTANASSSRATQPEQGCVDTTGIKYGTLVSCIDFGGQIGAWLMVPIVSALGISRENDWAHLDVMILLCSIGMCITLGFLPILPRSTI